MPTGDLHAALVAYAETLTTTFSSPIPAYTEEQLKLPIVNLLTTAGRLIGVKALLKPESPVSEIHGRPDMGLDIAGALSGHVELKAPGHGARPNRFTSPHDREQWRKFQSLPNLIYTDGIEWALYRTGKLEGKVVRLSGDPTTDGSAAIGNRDAPALGDLLRVFMAWHPITPRSSRELARLLAPLCRLLRTDVRRTVDDPSSALSVLWQDWRVHLFPNADAGQFADAYAQTLTYALLLARFGGEGPLDVTTAARTLRTGHALLGQVLKVMTDDEARQEIETPVALLERVIGAVDPAVLARHDPDPWLYFYEDFLAEYDPALRRDRGVYYTPAQVVQAQVRLVASLLMWKFHKEYAFAAPDVVTLDPGAGTGTYPLAAIQLSLEAIERDEGPGALGQHASALAKNIHAFEILVGPYAVAHLRLTERIAAFGGSLPLDGVHVYLTDTLESPHAAPPKGLPLPYRKISKEHERAQAIKRDSPVFVCIGNPPYDRQAGIGAGVTRKGGWVRFGEGPKDPDRPIFDAFLAPVRDAEEGGHAKNLYNDYVYFWRWALWKVFESESSAGPGIVSFITASSYLRGPGFAGMREVLRRRCDEIWIIDLEGDNRSPRRTENVFAIQTPVAIAVAVRYDFGNEHTPAKVHYTKLEGSRDEKLSALSQVNDFDNFSWASAPTGWTAPLVPEGSGVFFSWPHLADVFPWRHSGSQVKRTWPIAPEPETLERRWNALLSGDRAALFRETRDRTVKRMYKDFRTDKRLREIDALPEGARPPPIERYGFRSFDRQWLLVDPRLADFLRPDLWRSHSDRQVYLTSLLSTTLGAGPAATVTAFVPDLHHFRGSYGGADVMPLWRYVAGPVSNIAQGVFEALEEEFGHSVSPEDVFAYSYGLLSSPTYTERFAVELSDSGPRLPITSDSRLFADIVDLGRELVFLHTYAQRFVPRGTRRGNVPRGSARMTTPIPDASEAYPESFSYNETERRLRVGVGEFAPVVPAVWSYSVSSLQVVRSWLGYRMRGGAGRSAGDAASPLDGIRAERWTTTHTRELLELLWVLERTVELQPRQAALLARVVANKVITASAISAPTYAERQSPATSNANQQRMVFEP